ncbi:MAG TPA: HEAT repeat domain-containing protein [Tepidisphaeraceae bacterium]|nr:HEAT repeat domain-containing protein [Tepidisphaeraceae bacterium]
MRSAALAELWDRQQMGQLSESQSNAYVECILAIGFSVDDNGRSEMMDDMIVVCQSNQRAIQALVADLRIPDSPDPKHPYITHLYPLRPPRTIGEYAAEILMDSGQPAWDAMRQEARTGDPWVLKHWLDMNGYARGGLLDERLAKLMLESTSSKDRVLAERASGSIFQMATDSITFPSGPALGGLSDPHPEIRLASLCLLGDLDKPPPLDVLLPLLHDPNSDVRWRAETELTSGYKWTSDTRAVSPLIAILDDPQSTLRREAVEGLSHFKTSQSIRAIALALKDEKLNDDATIALEEIGGEMAFEAVVDVLDDMPEDFHGYAEALADRLCKGSYKITPYWQKHEAAKARALNAQP